MLKSNMLPRPHTEGDEEFALNVAPRYTCGSPALVSRYQGNIVAEEEREAYEHALDGPLRE